MIGLHQLEEYASGELHQVVTLLEWRPVDSNDISYLDESGYPLVIKIKVVKTSGGKFIAEPSHKVQNSNQAAPYMSCYTEDSVEDAIKDCIRGLRMFMGIIEETKWPKNESF